LLKARAGTATGTVLLAANDPAAALAALRPAADVLRSLGAVHENVRARVHIGLAWPRRRRPLIRGADREEIEQAFPQWSISDVAPSQITLPKLVEAVLRPDEQWYRLRRRRESEHHRDSARANPTGVVPSRTPLTSGGFRIAPSVLHTPAHG
jgi:hypothetical protein